MGGERSHRAGAHGRRDGHNVRGSGAGEGWRYGAVGRAMESSSVISRNGGCKHHALAWQAHASARIAGRAYQILLRCCGEGSMATFFPEAVVKESSMPSSLPATHAKR